MMFILSSIYISLASLALAAPPPSWPHNGPYPSPPSQSQSQWNLKNFTSLVVFGDSYTDDSRLSYFIANNGSAPPVGWVDPVSYSAADGGRTWVEYVKQYTGANLYNYAVSGAVCSNDITPRWLSSINAPFPAIKQYEIPAYVADSQYVFPNGTKFMDDPSDETVYAIWIGTNDLGVEAFLQDEQVAGTNLTTYVSCVYDQLKRVYENGGRYFVILNVAPLNQAPMYQPDAGPDGYWPNKTGNYSEISGRMMEQVVTVNALYDYRTPYEVRVAESFPGASFAVYNVHDLVSHCTFTRISMVRADLLQFADIIANPSEYLNGSAPLNTTGFIHHCNLARANCTSLPSPDSFVWYDELHPSEQTERIVAQNFVDVVKGASKWATYWST
jgi:phospholipase/lecithinase/hemolysin